MLLPGWVASWHEPGPGHALKEKLEDLDVATGLGEIAAPGVQAVAGDQEAVERRTARGREVGAGDERD